MLQDLEGTVIQTISGKKYVLTDMLAETAQGVIYSDASDKLQIKLYTNGDSIQQKKYLNKLKWLIAEDYPKQFIKPLELIETPYVGYVMEKKTDFISLNKLLIPPQGADFFEWYNQKTGGLRRRFFLAYQIAMQFARLHDLNRAYSDISGNNIFVDENPALASICITDMDNIYIPGKNFDNIFATSRYMAPEIMNKKFMPDTFTDDYSLAVILFELLRIGHPYVGDLVENGNLEQRKQAYSGLYPYEDDPDEIGNKSSQMLPISIVTSKNLRKLFRKTFIDGKENRIKRASAREFSLACLEASNLVMKCSTCGAWHLAEMDGDNQYVCPWCESVNDEPMLIQFKDMYYMPRTYKRGPTDVFKEKDVNVFVLREEKNTVTNNYISNFYIKRESTKPIKQYFIIQDRDKKFYILNPDKNELYLQKAKSEKKVPILDKAIEIKRGDTIFFQNMGILEKEAIAKNSQGLLFRYAVIR